ncbi:MAG: CsgG/HfaB family protein [Prevotellaceae bacterium]|jgi:hypothetical protein|nr:CsgG/HfaB family protein [Prevotellaceae bacterium]
MRKVLILLSLLATVYFPLYAQDGNKLRVAIFDPSSSGTTIDEGTKVAVRELISSIFVNTGKYNIVERSLLEKVMKEQEFSNSGAVDDSQATEVGKLAGANKVILSVVTLVGGRNMLSIKIIDVQTATIDQQKTRIISSNDLLDTVEPLTAELLGEELPESARSTSTNHRTPVQEQTPIPAVINNNARQSVAKTTDVLYASRMKVFSNGRKLSRLETRNVMANTNALRIYNSGVRVRRAGNALLWTGVGIAVIGALSIAGDEDEDSMIGYPITSLGIGSIVTGWVLRGVGRRKVGHSVEIYNRSNHTSNVEFDLGLTRNGIGLVVNF